MTFVDPQRSASRTTTTEKVTNPMRRLTLGRAVALVAVTTLAASCAEDKPLNTFEPRGPKADGIYNLMTPIWWLMAVIFVLVIGGTIALAIKGRVKPEDYDENDLPKQIHGHTVAELGWTIAPALLLAGVSIPMVAAIWELEEKNEVGELDVMVIGNQWWWEYRYDIDGDGFFEDANGDGLIYGVDSFGADGIPNSGDEDTADQEWPLNLALDDDDLSVPNQLVIPIDVQVDLTLTSRDVVHSFWIPRLNGKRDTVPGRLTYWSLEADEAGEFNGWCTEFCGLSHARMRMSVVALPQAEFDEWLANQSKLSEVPDAPVEVAAVDENGEAVLDADGKPVMVLEEASHERAGYDIFVAQCSSCHVINNDDEELQELYGEKDFIATELISGAAPNLTHFATRSVFAGAIFSQYFGIDPDDDNLDVDNYLTLAADGKLNEDQIKAWIADASSQKDMLPDNKQGMTSFPALTDHELDNLVAYFATLD